MKENCDMAIGRGVYGHLMFYKSRLDYNGEEDPGWGVGIVGPMKREEYTVVSESIF